MCGRPAGVKAQGVGAGRDWEPRAAGLGAAGPVLAGTEFRSAPRPACSRAERAWGRRAGSPESRELGPPPLPSRRGRHPGPLTVTREPRGPCPSCQGGQPPRASQLCFPGCLGGRGELSPGARRAPAPHRIPQHLSEHQAPRGCFLSAGAQGAALSARAVPIGSAAHSLPPFSLVILPAGALKRHVSSLEGHRNLPVRQDVR